MRPATGCPSRPRPSPPSVSSPSKPPGGRVGVRARLGHSPNSRRDSPPASSRNPSSTGTGTGNSWRWISPMPMASSSAVSQSPASVIPG